MDSFGAYLREQRENKGIRLEEIASITKIHVHSLELLEADRWRDLPPEPFIRGFILAYAKYVGLNTEQVLDRYKQATVGSRSAEGVSTDAIVAPAVPSEIVSKVWMPSMPKVITGLSLVAVIGLATVLINVGRQADETPSVPMQVTMLEEPSGQVVQSTEPTLSHSDQEENRVVALSDNPGQKSEGSPVAGPAPGPGHEVAIEAKERTWVKVVIDEDAPLELFLEEGKSASYRALKKIKVVLGNSTGSRVLHNGREAEGRAFMGTIKSFKFPKNAHFPQDVPTKQPAGTQLESDAAEGA